MKFRTVCMVILAMASTLVGSVQGFGDSRVGNGGDVVLCHDANGNIGSIELLDFYEARGRGMVPELGSDTLTLEEKFELAMARLAAYEPRRAREYRHRFAEFFENVNFTAEELVDIPDSGHLTFPPGCEVVQIAIQRVPQFPEDKTFIINLPLWDALDDDNRVGLLIHEFIYQDAIASDQHSNSISSRYLNALIVSNKIASLSLREFIDRMIAMKFSRFEYGGAQLRLFYWAASGEMVETRPDFFHGTDMIQSAELVEGDLTAIPFYSEADDESISLYYRQGRGVAKFYPNGQVKQLFIDRQLNELYVFHQSEHRFQLTNPQQSLLFHENGKFQQVVASAMYRSPHLYCEGEPGEAFWTMGTITFRASGDLRSATSSCRRLETMPESYQEFPVTLTNYGEEIYFELGPEGRLRRADCSLVSWEVRDVLWGPPYSATLAADGACHFYESGELQSFTMGHGEGHIRSIDGDLVRLQYRDRISLQKNGLAYRFSR